MPTTPAHSTITLYNSNINQDKNMIVDSIDTYLEDVAEQEDIEDFQFIKPALDITIKLDLTQMAISPYQNFTDFDFNYVKIVNFDENGNDGTRLLYFIEDIKWVSQKGVMLKLHMDVLNTFCATWTEANILDRQTRIRRATATKYTKNTLYNKLKYNIPLLCDDLSPIKYKKDDYILEESIFPTEIKWYLVYRTRITSEELESRPVDCYVTTNKDTLKFRVVAGNSKIDYSNMANDYVWILGEKNKQKTISFIDKEGNPQNVTLNSAYHAILLERLTSPNKIRISYCNWTSGRTFIRETISFYQNQWETQGDSGADNEIATSGITSYFSNNTLTRLYDTIITWAVTPISESNIDFPILPVDSIDRSDTTYIKIIEVPYCPIKLTAVGVLTYTSDDGTFDYSIGMIKLISTLTKLESTIEAFPSDATNINARLGTALNTFQTTYPNNTLMTDILWLKDELEPMLRHSNYYSCKYVYDTFEKDIALEELNGDMSYASTSKFNFKFHSTATINSRFMFDVSNNGYTYSINKEFYPNYLFIQRNNEVSLYSSAFINYLRSGYNYDQKNRFYRNIESGINIGVTGVESFAKNVESKGVASSVGGSLVGMAKSGLALYFQNASDIRSIEQKQVSTKLQGTSFQGADDLDLLDTYAKNKLHFMCFTPSDIMKKALHQLYFYTGYPQNYFSNSLPHSNRYWFDFVQADIVFKKVYVGGYSKEIQMEIVQKYSEGVTYFHKRSGNYDFEQKYVNHDHNLI